MNRAKGLIGTHCILPAAEIEEFASLAELALDLRWSWNHSTDDVWRQLDPELWSLTRNPWLILLTVSRARLQSLAKDDNFRKKVEAVLDEKCQAEERAQWFQRALPDAPLTSVAYFSMEFMLSEALPIYAGGLGNVAGDQFKAASCLGIPLVGVGLLYQEGYFRQVIDYNGAQQAFYPHNDPCYLPILPIRDETGEWLRLKVSLPTFDVWLRPWQVKVGRLILYLLDTNDPANSPVQRSIGAELYGGGPEMRLKQELVLGIGGWRLLHKLGICPEVCHLNEGHAAFAVLERARCFMEENNQPFDVALAVTRAGNLFTTHTPVAAGFDRFAPTLIEQYLGAYAQNQLGISLHDLLALGRANPSDPNEPFNMAYLAVRGSAAVNGVSRLHGQVSHRLFQCLFPRWPEEEVPVGYVTNGIHVATWDSAMADSLWTEACGKDRWRGEMETIEADLRRVPDANLWQMRSKARQSFIGYARERLARQLAAQGAPVVEVARAYQLFSPDILTIGFARRFATYKRPNLLLHDPARLIRILTDPKGPVQLVIAGKAHPADIPGQTMIEEWTHFIRRPEVRSHVIFLSDYDMELTEQLVQGIDLWVNTPRRPWEACGTSGMKVLVNGGLNLSELDGWWAEAYTPEVGWALGDGMEHGDDPAWDAHEAEQLYTLLEREVIPMFYTRDHDGIPTAWVERMRESMARLTGQFSANRAVQEYTKKYYLPAAKAYRRRAADKGTVGAQVMNWRRALQQNWSKVRFGTINVETDGKNLTFEVHVYLGGLDPDAVTVELYADGAKGNDPVRQKMDRGRQLVGVNGYVYHAQVPATRPATDYTPRIIPLHPDVTVPLEAGHILWQR
jgi:starch phosphorylase